MRVTLITGQGREAHTLLRPSVTGIRFGCSLVLARRTFAKPDVNALGAQGSQDPGQRGQAWLARTGLEPAQTGSRHSRFRGDAGLGPALPEPHGAECWPDSQRGELKIAGAVCVDAQRDLDQ